MPEKNPNILIGIFATLYAGALIFLFNTQNKNIAAVKAENEKKVLTTMCDERTENTRREVHELKVDTSKQWEVISSMSSTVTEIKTILETMVSNHSKRKGD